MHATLEQGQRRGDVRPDVDVEAVDAMFGALLARALLGEQPSEDWAVGVVTAVWPSIGRSGSARRGCLGCSP